MKKTVLLLISLFLLLGLCACGSLSASEKPVSGRYYLALLPDKKGKNTVEDVLDTTLRLKVGGGLVRTVKGEEEEGSWEADGRRITLRLKDQILTGKVTEDRIEIGDAVYIRGLKEARDLWQADADAYVADPLAEYEGKYYLAGRLEGDDNRVEKTEDVTLWLMPENEALLFEKGKLSLLSWDAKGSSVLLQQAEGTAAFRYENGCLSGKDGEETLYWFREKDEADLFHKAHPYVPRPYVPTYSGLEGDYYLAWATSFGKAVDIGRPGSVRISLLPDWQMTYEGYLYSEEGDYEILPDGRIELRTPSGSFTGSAEKGCLTLQDAGGDRYVFFDSQEKARTYYEANRPAKPAETDPTEPATEPVTESAPPEESTAQPLSPAAEDAAFWQGTWYGLVRLNNDCSGLYFLMRGTCYTVYVTLSMREDGTGTLIAYDPAKNFAERLLSGTVRCGENRTLILTEGLIEPFSVTIEGYSAAWDETRQLVRMGLTQAVSGGSIGGELYLRPWGETWEDQPELMKQLPDYQAYLEEIKTGKPRYTAD